MMNNQQFQFKVDGKIVTIFEDISKLSGVDRASLGGRTIHPRGMVYSREGTGPKALIEAGKATLDSLMEAVRADEAKEDRRQA